MTYSMVGTTEAMNFRNSTKYLQYTSQADVIINAVRAEQLIYFVGNVGCCCNDLLVNREGFASCLHHAAQLLHCDGMLARVYGSSRYRCVVWKGFHCHCLAGVLLTDIFKNLQHKCNLFQAFQIAQHRVLPAQCTANEDTTIS